MLARIYKPTRSAMTSAPRPDTWVLEFTSDEPKWVEPLMGWTASRDTRQQVIMHFDSRESAERFARRHDIPYTVIRSQKRGLEPKSYADNFRWGRRDLWTH